MTKAKELEGWIVSGYLYVDDGDEVLVQEGVEKATVYVCSYCEEGWHRKKADADNCCSKEVV